MSLEDRVREAVERAIAKLREEFDGQQQQLIQTVHGIAAEEQTAWRSHLEGAVDEARRFKPEIPDFGEDEIPIRHELELELILNPGLSTVE